MNKTISLIRIAILFALGMVAFLLIFGEEQDRNQLTWLFQLLVDKTLGFGLVFFIARLYKHWSRIDPWFIAYGKMCDEVMHKANSTQF